MKLWKKIMIGVTAVLAVLAAYAAACFWLNRRLTKALTDLCGLEGEEVYEDNEDANTEE